MQKLSKDKLNHILFLLLFTFFAFHRFYNLGFKELQMWDESLYAVRAKSIYYFNNWIDQTNHAVGGLYSSSHPPLFIWLTAILYKIFGINEFTTRFFSALFASLTILITFMFIKKFFDLQQNNSSFLKPSILSIPMLGSIYLFNFYSRQAQLDIPYIFFVSLSIYFYLYSLNNRKIFLILSGVFFGLALMTKIIVGFFAPISIGLFLLLLILRKEIKFKEAAYQLATVTAIGILIALPWHIYMLLTHRYDFINTFFKFHIFERLSRGVEENIPELGFFYILNQLIVQFPPIVLVFFDLFDIVKNFKSIPKEKILIHSWFWSTFLITSISKTKIPTYALPSLVPAVIISSTYLFEIANAKKKWLQISLLLISILWSSSQSLRDGIKNFLKFNLDQTSATAVIIFIVGFVLILVISKKFLNTLIPQRFKLIAFISTILIGFYVILKTEIFIDYSRFYDGAEKVCQIIDTSKCDTVLYLHTKHSTEGMNPQLTFYSYRKLSRSIAWIEIPRHEFERISKFLSSTKSHIVIVEKTAKDKTEKRDELNNLKRNLEYTGYKPLEEVRRYILYKKNLMPTD